jgi:two-component sensor histidine kinase
MAAQAVLSVSRQAEESLAISTLVETIEDLQTARSPLDIAAVVRTQARRLTGADGIAVVLRDDDRCYYVDEDAIGPLWKGKKFPMTACISGWAMLNRQTAVIPDIYLDPRIPHDAYRPTFVKSLVMTPVGRDEPIAAIGAYWATEREPTDQEIHALSAIARATATSFENVRLVGNLTEAVERREFLIRELDHRVKNMLASVQSIATQTLRSARDQQAFVEVFAARLQALSHAHELLTKRSWKNASLRDLADAALSPFGMGDRIVVEGPDVGLKPETAVSLLLGVHELASNAVKYGALSNETGRVRLNWDVDMESADRTLSLEWTESGGPPVAPPARRSMGVKLIERGLPYALGGAAKLEFAPQGVTLSLKAPLSDRVALI